MLYIMYNVDSDFLLSQSQVFKLFIYEYQRFTENVPIALVTRLTSVQMISHT